MRQRRASWPLLVSVPTQRERTGPYERVHRQGAARGTRRRVRDPRRSTGIELEDAILMYAHMPSGLLIVHNLRQVRANASGTTKPTSAHGPPRSSGFPLPAFAGTSLARMTWYGRTSARVCTRPERGPAQTDSV